MDVPDCRLGAVEQLQEGVKMATRTRYKGHFIAPAGAAVLILSLVALGCNSGSTRESTQTHSQVRSSAKAVASGAPEIDLNCVINHLQNPPESFHYTFKEESDNPWAEEADVTPQMIDGSFKSNYMPAAVPLHGAPAEIPHQYQWAIGRMASLFAIVRGTSAVVNGGAEAVNGYNTTKLSIDTGRSSGTEQGLDNTALGPGGFEKGTVWVTSQGCPVKVVVDEELHAKDGSISGKAHYEEAMIRK
jgi:hypothetical protein